MSTPRSLSIQAKLLNYSRARQDNHNHTLSPITRGKLASVMPKCKKHIAPVIRLPNNAITLHFRESK